MEELLVWIARGLVDEPDAVQVERIDEGDVVVLRLHVADGDVGKVIGGTAASRARFAPSSARPASGATAGSCSRSPIDRRSRARARRPGGAAARAGRSLRRRACERRTSVGGRSAPSCWSTEPRRRSSLSPARRRWPARDQARPTGRARRPKLSIHVSELPPPAPDSYYAFQLVGLSVVDEEGRELGSVVEVYPGVANDNLELADGTLVPLIDDAVRTVDLAGGRIVVERGFLGA
jgi:hypothetical protein